jgi:hypothetical protein
MRFPYIQPAAILVLGVAVVALGWWLNIEAVALAQLEHEVRELRSNPPQKSDQADFSLYEKCSLQAEKVFGELGYKLSGGDAYQSHYNKELDKCFMTVDSLFAGKSGVTQNKFLTDAYEQRGYADYVAVSNKDGGFNVVSCKLTPAPDEERDCKSEDEYKAFVSRYME